MPILNNSIYFGIYSGSLKLNGIVLVNGTLILFSRLLSRSLRALSIYHIQGN